MSVEGILKQFNVERSSVLAITQFKSAEDGSLYNAWKIELDSGAYVLKKAKGDEILIYSTFFSEKTAGAPQFIASTLYEGEDYFLMEYAEGEDLCVCNRQRLVAVLDALISIQSRYWQNTEHASVGFSFEKGLKKAQGRMEYLKDEQIERVYLLFLKQYSSLPRTLCHEDLLPFNVLASSKGATLIDWEYAGILPYPVSLARLIAHAEESENAFFYMTDEDKSFAIDYYYHNFIKNKGIAYADYIFAIDCFLLYEYCEWIMLGNKYADANMDRYHSYLKKAKEHLKKLGF